MDTCVFNDYGQPPGGQGWLPRGHISIPPFYAGAAFAADRDPPGPPTGSHGSLQARESGPLAPKLSELSVPHPAGPCWGILHSRFSLGTFSLSQLNEAVHAFLKTIFLKSFFFFFNKIPKQCHQAQQEVLWEPTQPTSGRRTAEEKDLVCSQGQSLGCA